jgi:hypothetical protein
MAGRVAYYGNIVKDGLILDLDAAKRDSYPGSGTRWNDISGLQNNGTLTNGPTFDSNNGGGIVFDGSNDYVDCGTTIQNSFTNLTLEIIYTVGENNKSQVLLSTFSNTTSNGWGIEQYNTNKFNVFVFNGSGSFLDIQSNILSVVGTTYAISMVFSSLNKLQMYINGILHLEKSTTFSSTTKTSPFITRIGNYVANAVYLKGTLYSVKQYDRALTAQEILQNYNALKGRYGL